MIPQGNRSHGSEREGSWLDVFFWARETLLTFAFVSIGSVEEERWWADALSRLDALLISTALSITTAAPLCWGTQTMVRVATVSIGTDTVVSSGRVETVRSITTDLSSLCALIDIGTGSIALRSESLRTGAVTQPSSDGDAFGTLRALSSFIATSQDALAADELIRRLALAFQTIALIASHVGIAVESRWTVALITSG